MTVISVLVTYHKEGDAWWAELSLPVSAADDTLPALRERCAAMIKDMLGEETAVVEVITDHKHTHTMHAPLKTLDLSQKPNVTTTEIKEP